MSTLRSEPSVIAPGEQAQVTFKVQRDGTVKSFALGPGAEGLMLYVGREKFNLKEAAYPGTATVKAGGLVLLVVKNTSEEVKAFSSLLEMEDEAEPVVDPVIASLSQKLGPEPTMTAADLGVKAGHNEVAICLTRNEATFLLDSLRAGTVLEQVVKYGIIRRLDAVLKAPSTTPRRGR